MTMSRRDFLKLSSAGLAAVAVGTAGTHFFWRGGEAIAAAPMVDLEIVEAFHEMTDKVQIPVWAFKMAGDVPRVPGMMIAAVEGDEVEIRVTNRHSITHGFSIPGVVTATISPGATTTIRFNAPSAGTYLYFDHLNAPVNRVMGLHGALVTVPRIPFTPYSQPTSNVTRLFRDFGTTDHFPGNPWDPARSWIWLVNSYDPVKNNLASLSPNLSAAAFTGGYVPQYFTISGKSGFFASHDPHIAVSGHIGQPAIVRCLNAGLVWHSMHLHGNHVYVLTESNFSAGTRTIQQNIVVVDVWSLPPMIGRDVIIPFIKPPDIPQDTWTRMLAGASDEIFPLDFPMHCHAEPSQTAAGGNYPNGLLTHFMIEGPTNPADAVIQVTKAELRLKFGKLSLRGVTSLPAGSTLEIHAGSTIAPQSQPVGTAIVQGGGAWSFSGRALRALATRSVSITAANGGDPQRLDIRPTIR
ncbi:multicopper oxidase domain-containing protein [Geobacter sp. DSM 9736]|uniref:multicopper oxidase domain-containing protein n=1 Tax=Geobacter sp. DSM 9736 TaxID=1277350 RepID=UPI000B6037D9|nr:multicopper oxidase domain-containing protein [Geobacter sp. DSM 9736]SNB44961.1 Tat (twin-arginine translocation) pathway signal sequence [Geobacter sp. DSM 9736]